MKRLILALMMVIVIAGLGWAVSDPVPYPFWSKVPGHEVTGDLDVTGGIDKPAKFIVYGDGSTYSVYDGHTNKKVYSGSEATASIQYAVDNLTSGRTSKEKVIVKGTFNLGSTVSGVDSTVDLDSYTVIDCQGNAELTAVDDIHGDNIGTATEWALFENSDGTNGNKHIEIKNCTINGNDYVGSVEGSQDKTFRLIMFQAAGGVQSANCTGGSCGTTLTTASTLGIEEYADFVVEIDADGAPDTFKWSNDGGKTYTTGVAIDGTAQALSHGITVTFGSTTAGGVGDNWTFKTKVVNDVKVLNNILLEAPDDGVESVYVSDFEYKNNYCSVTRDDCFSMIEYSNNGVVEGNTTEYGQSNGFGSSGFEVEDGAYNIVVSDNTSRYQANGGMKVILDATSSYEAPHNITFEKNKIYKNEASGILMSIQVAGKVAAGISYIENMVYENATNGITCQQGRGMIIAGNNIYDNGTTSVHSGVALINDCDNGKVINNNIHDNSSHGIILASGSDNNIIKGNHIYDNSAAAAGSRGLQVNGDYNIITENVLFNINRTNQYGMKIVGGTGNKFYKNHIRDAYQSNYINDSGTDTIWKDEYLNDLPTTNEGLAQIDCGATVTHGLYKTPDYVYVSLGADSNPTNIYVDTIGATTFTIQCTDTGDNLYDFYWKAVEDMAGKQNW